jgi:hypothetical protein
MAGRYGKKARKKPIEVFAMQYLSTSKTPAKSGIWRRMSRTFGKKATDRAITNMANTLTLCDPNFRRPI